MNPSIHRWHVHRMWNSKFEPPFSFWRRWADWLRFYCKCRSLLRSARPRVVIAYDTLASIFIPACSNTYWSIYHFHELSQSAAGETLGPRLARRQALVRSRDANLVVFSDRHRARIFQERAGLGVLPKVVMNCSRRLESVPASPLRKRLTELGFPPSPLVCYLGSIGADQGLVEAAMSMKHWPTDALLVLIGPASDTMKGAILEAAGATPGAAKRVIFLGAFPHRETLALAAGGDVGLALVQPNNESWLYSAGAINKRFEYMALGLPQVTNNGPGVAEIVEANQVGLCVEPRDPAAIGSAIRQLLDDAALRRRFSENARRQHLERFNYEIQFAEVASWIACRCAIPAVLPSRSPLARSSLDVLLVIRSCAEHYPPTINQANLLSEAGLRVGVVDLLADAAPEALDGAIRRWRAHRMWNSKLEAPYSFWKRWADWLRFFVACRSVIRATRPRVVIAYDTLGSIFIPPAPTRYRTIYHFHELTGPESDKSFGPRFARLKAAERSRLVDLVVFSDSNRARLFQEWGKLSTVPSVVMNCPRRIDQVPSSPLRQRLAELGQPGARVVWYLGSVGGNQGLPQAAHSMRHWPSDSVLVMAGAYSPEAKEEILANARCAGAAARVVFLGPQRHADALALTAGADLALALIQPNNPNLLYSAGAVNKRFEYMALGLSQVTNASPGVAEIIEHNQCGLCVDPNSPQEIGAAVSRLLGDQPLLRRMGENGRRLHLERYNYEVQFRPVLEQVARWCAAGRSGDQDWSPLVMPGLSRH